MSICSVPVYQEQDRFTDRIRTSRMVTKLIQNVVMKLLSESHVCNSKIMILGVLDEASTALVLLAQIDRSEWRKNCSSGQPTGTQPGEV
jgi:hypothetical protein